MTQSVFVAPCDDAVPLHLVSAADCDAWIDGLDSPQATFVRGAGFDGALGAVLALPGNDGVAGFVMGLGKGTDAFAAGLAARKLPAGTYALAASDKAADHALGFALGHYKFTRYLKDGEGYKTRLVVPEGVDSTAMERIAGASHLARDLINIPAEDMGPDQLEQAVRDMAAPFGADIEVIVGDDLLVQNYPLIHAVGRASHKPPRLIHLEWGRPDAPRVSLVGKGVCFDTGGLDLKPSAYMGLMKKDMGGAANTIALAQMIMAARLDVRLALYVPAVENAVAGNAMRPSDIFTSRKGLTVQIDNTDAEGRLVLADALTRADEDAPELLIDMATLTGAARVALGADVPPFFSDDDAFCAALMQSSGAVHDPLWRLPLWQGYEADVGARIADITNAPAGGMAGAITAALFLKRFVENADNWVHFDIYGWAPKDHAHVPMGGRDQAIRALFDYLVTRYG